MKQRVEEDVLLYLENPELQELMDGEDIAMDKNHLQPILESKYE